jgi:nicotinamidase-related amidase
VISLAAARTPQPDVGNSFEGRELAPQVSNRDLRDMTAGCAKCFHGFVVRKVLHPRGVHRNHVGLRSSDLEPWKRGGGPNDAIAIADAGPMGRALVRGEPCWDIFSELAPAPSERVLDKPSYGPFATTDLDALLRGWGVQNLVLTGVTTDCCVTSCLREALDRGYDCLVLRDCVGSSDLVHHEAALTLMRKPSGVFGTTTTAEAFLGAIGAPD